MQPELQLGISTNLFLPQRLSPGLLETLVQAGASTIEVVAARHHFDYTDAGAVRELANWFRSNNVTATLHMPLYTASTWSRHMTPTVNLITSSKAGRIEAQDEVKRALESAEQVPFQTCVIHLGLRDDAWDNRSLDDSLTAIEHLKAFAGPLGMKLLLENLGNDVATPAHLVEIVRVGHFANVGFCLDTGHANLNAALPETSDHAALSGVAQAFEAFGDRLVELHVSDNHGTRAEALCPLEKAEPGSIDWPEVAAKIAALKTAPVAMLEIGDEQVGDRAKLNENAAKAFAAVGA